jgi:DNA processing protein
MSSIKTLKLTGTLKGKIDRCAPEVENLWMMGIDPHLLTHQPWVAVVGTRKPTPHGESLTRDIVRELARAGVVIVSGLAYGIDVLAHRTALEAGGETIAVLPSDLDKIYPAAHQKTAQQITEKGCLITEYSDNKAPRAYDFLSRNRIIAALADLVWIPEASERSGSLNTARHAKNMNVMVSASPGRPSDAMSAGTNQLLQRGDAKVVLSAQDIVDLLPIKPAITQAQDLNNLNDAQQRVIGAIKSGISDTTLLGYSLKIETSKLLCILTELEILDFVHQSSAGQWLPRH